MALAEELLAKGHTLGEVAARISYESDAAFSRAFKRLTGTAPGAIRKKGTREPAKLGRNSKPDFSGDFHPASREIKQERKST